MHKIKRLRRRRLQPYHINRLSIVLELVVVFVIFTSQVSAVTRFTNRSLFVFDTAPSAVSKYQVSLTYTTSTSVGSLDMIFCEDPIPQAVCVPPPGLDVSNAQLSDQSGITGYTITQRSTNHLVLSRTPGVVTPTQSSYILTNVVNPSDTENSFALRLSDYASTDASGPVIDLGSVLSSSNVGIGIYTQVAPKMSFCVAAQVAQDCSTSSGGNYSEMGELGANRTLTATSQMAAGTNASRGYVITAYGTTMEAGNSIIDNLTQPTVSAPGNNQFGINLVANNIPNIGSNPDGSFTNASPEPSYDNANKYMFKSGDVVASAPNVALIRRFTVSYIVNASPNLRAGVYTTTITYICSGRF